jgi:transcription initiation factor TFIID subunit TAF12
MTKIELFALLRQVKESEPDNAAVQTLIKNEIFSFSSELSIDEKELFEYCNFDYIQTNPGLNNNQVYSSYVGDYISDSGDHSGHLGEHS